MKGTIAGSMNISRHGDCPLQHAGKDTSTAAAISSSSVSESRRKGLNTSNCGILSMRVTSESVSDVIVDCKAIRTAYNRPNGDVSVISMSDLSISNGPKRAEK